jgi:two-component system, NarL family, response regulator NreC
VIRILVVDDFDVVRRGVISLLREQTGWQVVGEASNGLEAVEKAAKLKPDVVILDANLPQLSGWEAAPLIREAVPTCRIIFLSQHDGLHAIRQAERVGASGYVCKSDAGRELLKGIRAVLRQEEFFTSSSRSTSGQSEPDDKDQDPLSDKREAGNIPKSAA